MSDERLRGVVFAHGLMAAGLVDAVRTITGCPQELLVPLSNVEGSPEVLRQRLAEITNDHPAVVFTDVRASSCSTLALAALREGTIAAVVSGVNLPMLLHFVFQQEASVDDLLDSLIQRGRDGIERSEPAA